jgi:hypothetical protein
VSDDIEQHVVPPCCEAAILFTAITSEPEEVMEGRRIDGARDAEGGGRGGLGRERKAAERYRGREGEDEVLGMEGRSGHEVHLNIQLKQNCVPGPRITPVQTTN